ncbi:alkaline phosphatase family protein [Rubellicoccus peritrichatus]|uniref:Alkaline phosphatase family protein n=1 Tax=Rubellicoccus peritrichatus TaxID=3080537 RepID=A0AAQ3L5R6_9BACT|nr:alkaline phosphatase family protein [Puniceicoccus sp. CR14]WOO39944.1 alkaline phosphatase family protein [Puniceicoccus sp. CR14]
MPERKVLLIGWDAADWNVARPLIEQGKMPALKKLMDDGVWGNLATIRPVLSPMLWTSIATGKRAWKHGIHGFSEPCPATGGIRPITNLSRKTKAVWNIFNQHGWKSNVIGWWPSHPAEPIDGVMVSNHFQQAVKNVDEDWPMRPGTVHPKELEEPLKEMRIHPAELENEHILPFIPKAAEIDQEKDKRMESCAKIIAEISGIHAAATACMQLEPWDYMAVYYDGIDHFGHGFMKYHPPRQPWVKEEEFELYKDVIEAGYRFHDMMLGVLMQIAGDDTTIMLISDHGFEPGNLRPQSIPNEPAGPAAEHSPYGIFCLRGPGIQKGERIYGASLLDIAPTILHLYGLPVGRDMDGKVLVNCFEEEQTVEFVDSWDDIEGDDGSHPAGAQLDAVESRESLKQLVDLGYIDEPNPDQGKAIDETIRELQYNLVQAYMDGGRYTEAARILEKQWDRWPEESRFGTKLLSCWLALEEADKSRKTFDLMLERKQAAAESAGKELKKLQEELKEKEEKGKKEAEEKGEEYKPEEISRSLQQKLRRLRGHAGTNPHALAYLNGCVLALEGKNEEALEMLKKAEAVQVANQPSLYSKMGDVHFELKNWDEAEKCYQKVLEIAPNSHDAHLGLAQICMQRGNHFEAAGEALASLELIFHNPKAHTVYGTALIQIGKPKLAEQTLLTAISQNPNYPLAHQRLAQLYDKVLKQPEKAKQHSEWAETAKQRIADIKSGKLVEKESLPEFPKITEVTGRLKEPDGQPLVVVSGLPRSGTSLMMQMLDAGGISIVTDKERVADESNPKGYYEDERVKKLPTEKDRSWLKECRGQAIKIIAPLLGFIPPVLPVKIIFMQRDPNEVITSQRTMLERDGKTGATTEDEALARTFAAQLAGVNQLTVARDKVELLVVGYADAVNDPKTVAQRVADFLGVDFDADKAAKVADKSLYRTKG